MIQIGRLPIKLGGLESLSSPPLQFLYGILGTLQNHDGNVNKIISSLYLYPFAIIPICSTCIVGLNYPVIERVGMAFKLIQRKENLMSCAHVLLKTLNLVISHCCLAECSKKMYQNL